MPPVRFELTISRLRDERLTTWPWRLAADGGGKSLPLPRDQTNGEFLVQIANAKANSLPDKGFFFAQSKLNIRALLRRILRFK